jgi:hypothetical protein
VAGGAILCGLCAGSKNGPAKPLPLALGIVLSLFFAWWAVRLDDSPKRFLRSFSWTGLAVWFAFFFIPTTIMLPVFESAKSAAETSKCFSGMRKTTEALLMYAMDFDDRLPSAKTWRTVSREYGSMAEECPEKRAPFGFGFNSALSEALLEALEHSMSTVMLFETETQSPDGVGDRNDIVFRHGPRTQIGKADGSARWYSVSGLSGLRWQP